MLGCHRARQDEKEKLHLRGTFSSSAPVWILLVPSIPSGTSKFWLCSLYREVERGNKVSESPRKEWRAFSSTHTFMCCHCILTITKVTFQTPRELMVTQNVLVERTQPSLWYFVTTLSLWSSLTPHGRNFKHSTLQKQTAFYLLLCSKLFRVLLGSPRVLQLPSTGRWIGKCVSGGGGWSLVQGGTLPTPHLGSAPGDPWETECRRKHIWTIDGGMDGWMDPAGVFHGPHFLYVLQKIILCKLKAIHLLSLTIWALK